MTSSSSYAPDESQSTITQEETWLQGSFLSSLFFGIETTLCILAFLAILRRRTPKHSRMDIILLVYIAVLFAIVAASQGLLLQWIQIGFIAQRNYPGGPSAFFNNEWSIPSSLAETILTVVANWMMESLLVRLFRLDVSFEEITHTCPRCGGVGWCVVRGSDCGGLVSPYRCSC